MQIAQFLNIKVGRSSERLQTVAVSSLFVVAICSGRKAVPLGLLMAFKINTAVFKASPKRG